MTLNGLPAPSAGASGAPVRPDPEVAAKPKQRRIRDWRAVQGPDREVYFEQTHPPGREAQLDFTHCAELGVRIAGTFEVRPERQAPPALSWLPYLACAGRPMAGRNADRARLDQHDRKAGGPQ